MVQEAAVAIPQEPWIAACADEQKQTTLTSTHSCHSTALEIPRPASLTAFREELAGVNEETAPTRSSLLLLKSHFAQLTVNYYQTDCCVCWCRSRKRDWSSWSSSEQTCCRPGQTAGLHSRVGLLLDDPKVIWLYFTFGYANHTIQLNLLNSTQFSAVLARRTLRGLRRLLLLQYEPGWRNMAISSLVRFLTSITARTLHLHLHT